MTELKHTPGPWGLETVPTSCGICHKVGPFPPNREGEKNRHACLYSDYPSPDNAADRELLANARLIAAAPELLEALLDCREALRRTGHDGELAIVNAAIAKATGGTL